MAEKIKPWGTTELGSMIDALDEISAIPHGSSYGIPREEQELKVRLAAIVSASNWETVANIPTLSWLEQENAQLRVENHFLLSKLQAIEERLENIEAVLPEERVIILRELPKEQAEGEILELFSNEQTLYYSDIAERLGLDLELVVDICKELENRGEIHVIDETV